MNKMNYYMVTAKEKLVVIACMRKIIINFFSNTIEEFFSMF